MEDEILTDFDSFQDRIRFRVAKNREQFPEECDLIEYGISLSLELLKTTNARLTQKYTPQNHVPKNVAISYFLFHRGIYYIFATYKLASYGLVDPANETGRVILEMSLIKYALLYNPERITYYDKLFPHLSKVFDLINNEKFNDELYELEKEWRKINIQHGTTIRGLVEELYQSPQKDTLKLLESLLSIGSHANLTGAGANSNFNPIARKNILKFLIQLINFHFVSFQEVIIPYLDGDPALLTKLKNYDKSAYLLSEERLIPVPNKPEISEKLRIRYPTT